jgi:hypothetical protein
MLKYAQIFLNGRTRALSDVTDERISPSVAVTTLNRVHSHDANAVRAEKKEQNKGCHR